MRVPLRLLAAVLCWGVLPFPTFAEELITIGYRGSDRIQEAGKPSLMLSEVRTRWTETDHNGTFSPPTGYIICSANLVQARTGIPKGSTFTASLSDNLTRLHYADTQGTRGGMSRRTFREGPYTLIEVRLRLPTEGTQGCMVDGPVWLCGKRTPAGEKGCGPGQPGGLR
jgi:hypothetical protein